MKNLTIIFFTIVLFFTGCGSKNANNYFGHSSMYGNALQYTQGNQIKTLTEVKAIVNATYLNPIDVQFEDKHFHHFIIGTYIIDGYAPLYELTLNLQRPVSTTVFDDAHPLYDQLPLYNKWAQYQIVKFKKQEDVHALALKMRHLSLGSVKLNFESN
ncbi:MAG: hypothetical protein U9N30_05580 [Campylobacterota bacterium]|nr:hypothetical protein [Campylobacterota bacterium]